MKIHRLALPSVVLGGAAVLLAPAPESHGYSLIGGSLSTAQRDFRVYNNFSDSTANNNTTPDDQYPGWFGADMAIWKACVEWNSSAHGDGTGDPLQSVIGSGGANFDAYWAGATTGVGGTNDNIHSELAGSSGGVLAYCETPISNGWRIRYYSSWLWQDGPGSVGSGVDLQGVACHEYGHALGLGHSSTFGATMYASISGSGTAQRSIHNDDINGVKAIYGTASGGKPSITSVSVSGSTLTINGTNFSSTNNEVWFTSSTETSTSSNPFVKVTGVSSTGGGTQISVAIPSSAGPGTVMVKNSSSGNASLSESHPLDIDGGPGGGGPLAITSIEPAVISALEVGTTQVVTINGSGFDPATTTVEFDGDPVTGFPSPYTVVNSSTITFDPPQIDHTGLVVVSVKDGSDSASSLITVVANDPPALQAGTGDEPFNLISVGGLDVTMASQPGDVFFLAGSLDFVPTVIPGIVSLDIGNAGLSLVILGSFTVPSQGWTTTNLTIALPPVTTFWLQGAALDSALTLPAPESNTQEVLYLF